MPLEERDLGPAGIRYLDDYLTIGMPIAPFALERVRSVPGDALTFLDPAATDEVAGMFQSARALHPPFTNVPLKEWTATLMSPSRSVGQLSRHQAASLVASQLASMQSSCLACQNDVGFWPAPDGSDAIETSFGGSPLMLVTGPSSLEAVANVLDAVYMMRTLIVLVLSGRCDADFVWDAAVADRIALIVVEAYDGEGYVVWRPKE